MTDSPDKPHPETRHYDVSLFRLPVEAEPGNAEVGIGQRGAEQGAVKRRFWGTLAKRLDLTGRGSLVRARPYGTGHDELTSASEARLERLLERLSQKESSLVLVTDTTGKPSQLPRQVADHLEEITPQFFLRNIPRVERHANVRRLSYWCAVWREDQQELIELARKPRIDPVEFLQELSFETLQTLRAEALERVYGLDWAHDLQNFRPAPLRLPVFDSPDRRRIPIEEITDDPAPAGRETSNQRHIRTLHELGKRFDATRD